MDLVRDEEAFWNSLKLSLDLSDLYVQQLGTLHIIFRPLNRWSQLKFSNGWTALCIKSILVELPQQDLHFMEAQVLSNHPPVKIAIVQPNSTQAHGPKRMRSELQSSLRLQTLIKDQVATSTLMRGKLAHDILRCCTRRTTKIVHNQEIWESNLRQQDIYDYQKKLDTLGLQLQLDPQHLQTQVHVQQLESLLQEEKLQQVCMAQKQMHAQWLHDGDQCLKRFFQTLKSCFEGNRVLAIHNEVGVLHIEGATIRNTISDFFQRAPVGLLPTLFLSLAIA